MTIHPVVIRIPFVAGLAGPQKIERQRQFARRALQHSARLVGAPAGLWPATPERVPLPRDGFHWSLSHKSRFAAGVVAREPVGIDIEEIAPRGRDLSPALAGDEEWRILIQGRAFRPNAAPKENAQSRDREGADSHSGPVDWASFFTLWTAKEAALKANGKGIGGLKACTLSRIDPRGRLVLTYAGREFAVEHFDYGNHLAGCTCGASRLQWHVIEG
jgi:hypothetical protein